jgi:ABC-2 type transport system permease protein
MSLTDRPAQAGAPGGALRHGLLIIRTYVRLGMLNFMQYRGEFFFAVFNAVITLSAQVIGLWVIFAQTATLAGWTSAGLMLLVGVHFFISGLLGVVIRPSIQAMMEGIRLGTFDFTLTKPADSQLLASVQRITPAALADSVLGIAVIIWAGVQLRTVTPVGVLSFLLTLACGVVIVYSFILLLGTCAFWFVKLDNIMVIFGSVFGQAGRWPVTIFPAWLRAVLTFVIPVGFAVTVPAQALTGSLDMITTVLSIGVAVLFFVGSRVFWFFALRRYTGASA